MRVAIVGSRGIPANYGGFETFAQELSVRLVSMGLEVEVYCDSTENGSAQYKGVKLVYLKCTKTSNPLLYYYTSVRKAERNNDIVLICGAAGALFIYSKLFRRKVSYLTNMDGVEYLRDKWSLPKRLFVRFCIWVSVYLSDFVIADSKSIKEFLKKNYKISDSRIIQIEYGAYINDSLNVGHISNLNLINKDYYLVVSRLEPENNVELIIKGYLISGSSIPLIIVGNLIDTSYVKNLRLYENEKVRFLGGIYNRDKLNSLRFGCKAYLHGHSVGGTNPSLLESLGSGNIIIAHDNVFNREVTNNKMFYFKDSEECAKAINVVEKLNSEQTLIYRNLALDRITRYYNWERIAEEYFNKILQIKQNETIS
jgi:glycosyltransferase involved in cell wall biosynthesis